MENETKVISFFRFEDLRVYEKALDYFTWVMQQANTSKDFTTTVLLQPLASSAAKIAENIAEGSARHKPQFVQLLKDAKSSIRSCVVYTALCYKSGAFSETQYQQSHDTLIEMTKMVGAMIVSLQRSNQERTQTSVTTSEFDLGNDEGISFEY
ncbi:MAG: four helix bundle protein [Bacteroidales bacterium]|nr:four helix bundle protein [Bacteroidales bacterium]